MIHEKMASCEDESSWAEAANTVKTERSGEARLVRQSGWGPPSGALNLSGLDVGIGKCAKDKIET